MDQLIRLIDLRQHFGSPPILLLIRSPLLAESPLTTALERRPRDFSLLRSPPMVCIRIVNYIAAGGTIDAVHEHVHHDLWVGDEDFLIGGGGRVPMPDTPFRRETVQ